MKEVYTFIYNFFIVLKVACPVLSVIFVGIWFMQFLNPSLYATFTDFLWPFIYTANLLGDFTFTVDGKINNDLTCIVVSFLLILIHYVFGFIAARVVDIYLIEERRVVRKKSFDEKKVNVDIKKNLKVELKKIHKFMILLEVVLTPAYSSAQEKKAEFKTIQSEFYKDLLKTLSSHFNSTTGWKMGESLVVTSEEFENFDSFITTFSDQIKKFGVANIENEISSEFFISIDALKPEDEVGKKQEFLAQINSFNYKNKIVTTSAFKVKYEENKERKFRMDSLGISRFFGPDGKYTDFDLFGIKARKIEKD